MAALIKSPTHLARFLLFVLLLAQTAWSSSDESDSTDQEREQKEEYPQGIARLLFKNMRFRDLQPMDEQMVAWPRPLSDQAVSSEEGTFYRVARNPSQGRYLKREQQELLVNNLAALLADTGRAKNSASTLRMPSLRFG